MARAKNRDQVLKTLRKALDEDRTKTYVVEVSPLGLVEMTRQNVTDGVREILTERCPTCDGEGVVESAETVAIEVLRKLRDVVASNAGAGGAPDPGQPEGRRASCCDHESRACSSSRRRPARLPVRGRRRAPDRHVRGRRVGQPRGDRARGRCRSRSATRCWSRSTSRTCTTPATRSRGSTPTSSASPAAAASSASAAGPDREHRALGRDRDAGRRTARTPRWRGRRRLEQSGASAPRPQGRTAPFPRRERLRPWLRQLNDGDRADDTYAIVETGGKQYRAEKGTTLLVDRLPDDEGAKVRCGR